MSRRTRWLNARELDAWIGYRRLRVRLDAEVARDLERDSGMSMADYDVLTALDGLSGDGLRTGALAEALFWSQSRLSRQLGRMETRGLVERFAAPEDRRGISVRITPDGHDAIASAAPQHVASVRRHFIDLLGSEQQDAIIQAAAVVGEHLDAIGAPRALDVD